MAARSRTYLPHYIWACLILGSCKGHVYQNFSCITYNWDEYLTCSWALSPLYNEPVYTTSLTWQLPQFAIWSSCPDLSSGTCTWSLGGNDGIKDTDPHQPIRVCLHLRNDNRAIESECHEVDIENKVKPATVSDLVAKPQYPNCICAQWTHQKVIPSKIFSLEISSPGSATIQKNVRMDSFYDYDDSSEFQSGSYTNLTVCNLSYFVNYTISVRVGAIDMDDNQIGYWSDSLAINVVTSKTVPSGPPSLPQGGYTLSAVNGKGYRLARIYWTSLPKHAWNGETITYELEAFPVDGCGSRTVRLSRRNTSAEFDIMYTCSYNIKVWSRNEIGRSKDVSVLLLEQNVLQRPREVSMTDGHTDLVTISWLEPKDVKPTLLLKYTVYWCPRSPRQLCQGSFNYRTVISPISYEDVYLRTTVRMEGYPNVTYMYGVSTDINITGTVASSGFVWTDCSMLSTDKLKNPRISFEGYPSEKRVRVSWIYLNCAQAMIKKANSVHYDVTSCPSDKCEELSTESKEAYVDLHSISAGQEVCVTIAVRLGTVSGPTSRVYCYTQSLQGTQYPLHAVLVSLVIISGAVVVAIVGTILYVAFKWWTKPTKCSIPKIPTGGNDSEQTTTGDLVQPLVGNGSAVSTGRTTVTTETALIVND
ncbi:uncharacterized protein LOC110457863 [Mizuhopecten yessoensis]|uniref:Interleukin-6 receptor subunit beta n=1 Tax=Mizuhopecten yessoensis TaxID=6573 RepID=A0A210Q7T7_MIZYE|nr:uncharacterized protein LOC110457863 [Mizuhopecten yessoensis]XP_021364984.1 uncharacterized protein LOC110457863 [Mizuhopecten yessoensis]XP_021364985.1 uncharacterized protein LOC110457863 [Mizuhopecten yessoensis]OWF44791.1 Interleukin-6 receptor subunit beta [Mizuhopecten yessoensis]